uniref:DUF5641 domain-containing protein n=1 Tax=Heterorhabditis bacteriophora TaxID=37862 RepID=A0A1I7W6L4_HETBA
MDIGTIKKKRKGIELNLCIKVERKDNVKLSLIEMTNLLQNINRLVEKFWNDWKTTYLTELRNRENITNILIKLIYISSYTATKSDLLQHKSRVMALERGNQ